MSAVEALAQAWLSGLIQVAPFLILGAMAGLGLFLRSPEAFKFRLLIGHLIQGGLLGLVSGLMLALLWPDKRNDALVAAGIVAALSHIGTDRVRKILILLLRRKIDPEGKFNEVFDEPDSLELLREKLGTGGYSLAEIQAVIAEYKEKKTHEKDSASLPGGNGPDTVRHDAGVDAGRDDPRQPVNRSPGG